MGMRGMSRFTYGLIYADIPERSRPRRPKPHLVRTYLVRTATWTTIATVRDVPNGFYETTNHVRSLYPSRHVRNSRPHQSVAVWPVTHPHNGRTSGSIQVDASVAYRKIHAHDHLFAHRVSLSHSSTSGHDLFAHQRWAVCHYHPPTYRDASRQSATISSCHLPPATPSLATRTKADH